MNKSCKIVSILIMLMFVFSCAVPEKEVKPSFNYIEILENDAINILVGQTLKLRYDYGDKSVDDELVWDTGWREYFSLSDDGVITGLKDSGENSYPVVLSSRNNPDVYDKIIVSVSDAMKPIEWIQFDSPKMFYLRGDEFKISFDSFPAVSTNQIEWSSSDESVATVDNQGYVRITDNASGSATIYLKDSVSGNLWEYAFNISVPLEDFSFKNNLIAYQGTTITQEDMNALVKKVPEDATDTLRFEADDPNIIINNQINDGSFIIAENAPAGSYTIWAYPDGNPGMRRSFEILVRVFYDEFSLNPDHVKIKVGEKIKLEPQIKKEQEDKGITWKTSDPSIATVDEEGNVTAQKEGTATIIATCLEDEAQSTVEVYGSVLKHIPDWLQNKKFKTSKAVDIGIGNTSHIYPEFTSDNMLILTMKNDYDNALDIEEMVVDGIVQITKEEYVDERYSLSFGDNESSFEIECWREEEKYYYSLSSSPEKSFKGELLVQ